ncbi:hypothetical protein EGJ27_21600 [Pseudomonas sp. v388]|uniref:phage tail assembly chaperone n=1 Tax=Pseudomonas sp. v388 TaxID=2479849 RepID=UPI000F7A296A|nr:phage tail assembly chaperone [Pseudomonas sp. v388]RRV04433.1 hypothetical protein EGJ27_21600 [Pseudomonas sp. v388]
MYLYSPSTYGFYLQELHGAQVPADAIKLTDAQYSQLVTNPAPNTMLRFNVGGLPERVPIPDATEHSRERAWRDIELQRTQWLVDRHRDEQESEGSQVTLSEERFRKLQAYRQALREWPDHKEFPGAASRPARPFWMTELIEEQKSQRR